MSAHSAAALLGTETPLAHRFTRVLEDLRRAAPFDAAAILELCGGELVPAATLGLAPEVAGRRFVVAQEPRFEQALAAPGPHRFADHSALPDPYDGLLERDPSATARVHGCLVAPIRAQGELVGALTLDSVDPRALDSVDMEALAVVAALIGHALQAQRAAELLRERVQEQQTQVAEARREMDERFGGIFLGVSAAAERVRAEIATVASTDLPVLITGETGTGKEVVARCIHGQSPRSDRVLLQINCAALPEAIAEDELFGHARGAFTGADRDRPGKFQAAHRGTILFDEIGELPLALQPKLLRVLQTGEIQRVGADRPERVSVRVLAATHRVLEREIDAGRFRVDLFHRLNVYPIELSPLRERREDIPLFCGHFLDRARVRLGTGPLRLEASARRVLADYPWPGNVRELEHVLLRAALYASRGVARESAAVIEAAHLGLQGTPPAMGGAIGERVLSTGMPPTGLTLAEATSRFQRQLVQEALQRHRGNWSAAGRELGVDRANLYRLAKRLGIAAERDSI